MDEKDVLKQEEFDLEDIIKEFSEHPEVQETETDEAPEQGLSPEAQQQTVAEEPAPEEPVAAAPAVSADTIRLERIPDVQGQVRGAVKVQ